MSTRSFTGPLIVESPSAFPEPASTIAYLTALSLGRVPNARDRDGDRHRYGWHVRSHYASDHRRAAGHGGADQLGPDARHFSPTAISKVDLWERSGARLRREPVPTPSGSYSWVNSFFPRRRNGPRSRSMPKAGSFTAWRTIRGVGAEVRFRAPWDSRSFESTSAILIPITPQIAAHRLARVVDLQGTWRPRSARVTC
jgi:hypothetical protein